jgi:hypothetical protein
MNSTPRVKGWALTDSLLDSWADNFFSYQQKITDQVAQKKRAEKANFYQYETSEQYYIVPSVINLSKSEQAKDYNSWSVELQCEFDWKSYFHDSNAENESLFSPFSEEHHYHSLH